MKAALIGLGRMGLRHLQVIEELGLDVVGAADPFEAARAAVAERGVPRDRIHEDPLAMLGRCGAEVVVVASTAPSHAALVCKAAETGAKAILCEKPMAVSLSECDRMIAACKAAGARLAVNHQMRFMEQYTWSRSVVTGEGFGGLSSVNVVAGNFGMAMNGSHYFEMFRYMTGERPARVTAWFSKDIVPNPRGPQFEDRAGTVRLETASGQRFYMDASTDQGHGVLVSYGGPFGRLDVDELDGHARLVQRKAEHRNMPTTRYGMPWETTTHAITPADSVAPTRAVLSALLDSRDYPDGETGRMVCEVLVAAYLSHEQGGRTIELANAVLPRDRIFPWA